MLKLYTSLKYSLYVEKAKPIVEVGWKRLALLSDGLVQWGGLPLVIAVRS